MFEVCVSVHDFCDQKTKSKQEAMNNMRSNKDSGKRKREKETDVRDIEKDNLQAAYHQISTWVIGRIIAL